MHSMLDLETFGKRAGCAIRSIGAATFKPSGGKPISEFYMNVTKESCLEAGLQLDQSTLDWWSKQESATQELLMKDPKPLAEALGNFSAWFHESKAEEVWCHGAPFDAPILEACYISIGKETPWKFWKVRDTRTLHDMAQFDPKSVNFFGTKHSAIDDVRNQIWHVQLCAQKLFSPPTVDEAIEAFKGEKLTKDQEGALVNAGWRRDDPMNPAKIGL